LEFLAPVLRHHPPSAIICHADLMSQLLELIAESHELSRLIVVGQNAEAKEQLAAWTVSAVKFFNWYEIERVGEEEKSFSLPSLSMYINKCSGRAH
jgi:hypothetical protein